VNKKFKKKTINFLKFSQILNLQKLCFLLVKRFNWARKMSKLQLRKQRKLGTLLIIILIPSPKFHYNQQMMLKTTVRADLQRGMQTWCLNLENI